MSCCCGKRRNLQHTAHAFHLHRWPCCAGGQGEYGAVRGRREGQGRHKACDGESEAGEIESMASDDPRGSALHLQPTVNAKQLPAPLTRQSQGPCSHTTHTHTHTHTHNVFVSQGLSTLIALLWLYWTVLFTELLLLQCRQPLLTGKLQLLFKMTKVYWS